MEHFSYISKLFAHAIWQCHHSYTSKYCGKLPRWWDVSSLQFCDIAQAATSMLQKCCAAHLRNATLVTFSGCSNVSTASLKMCNLAFLGYHSFRRISQTTALLYAWSCLINNTGRYHLLRRESWKKKEERKRWGNEGNGDRSRATK